MIVTRWDEKSFKGIVEGRTIKFVRYDPDSTKGRHEPMKYPKIELHFDDGNKMIINVGLVPNVMLDVKTVPTGLTVSP